MESYNEHGTARNSNRILCGVLAIVIGGLGLQYFIIGKVVAGLLTILLTIVTCGFWSFLMLVQGIMILTMTDEQWEEKFVNTQNTYPLF